MQNAICILVASLTLVACSHYDTAKSVPAPDDRPNPGQTCDATLVQDHIGHDATQEMGAAILKESSAKTLRWGPPNSVWTMDYREDRVNVRYDEAMKIIEITCG